MLLLVLVLEVALVVGFEPITDREAVAHSLTAAGDVILSALVDLGHTVIE